MKLTSDYIEKFITGSSIDLNGVDVLQEAVRSYKPDSILELGSGVSTLAFLSEREHFKKIYSVDDSQKYLGVTIDMIPDRLKDKCVFIHAPIETQHYFGFPFEVYDQSSIFQKVNAKIDLLFIDGPYARRYGRVATLPLVSELLKDNCIIILDDAGRETERNAIRFWKQVWGDQLILLDSYNYRKGLNIFQIKNPKETAIMPFGFRRWVKSLIS